LPKQGLDIRTQGDKPPAARSDLGSIEPFWCVPLAELLQNNETNLAGLSSAQADARLAVYGANTVSSVKRPSILIKIGKRLAEPLVAILLIAAASSGITGDVASFVIIVAVILLSITLDVFQEHRAENAADALKKSVAIHADVRRDGILQSLPEEHLVPGDIVELRAGDLVPGDGVVIESRGAHVNQSLMTGESYPSEKHAGMCTATDAVDAFNALFAGTSVVSGTATMLVTSTGQRTRFGGIAAALSSMEAPSALERGVHRLGLMIIRLTAFLTLFVLLVHLSFGRPVIESFLFAIAIAVGLTPELLPMVMTVTLSRGALRMARKKIIVKRLAAIHDFGAMDVLCTDKTGTLTEAKISLIGYPDIGGKNNEHVKLLAAINSHFETGVRSPIDDAVIACSSPALFEGWKKIDEIPFDPERRSISVLVERSGKRLLIMKGAPEEILRRSNRYNADRDILKEFDDNARLAFSKIHDDEATKGYRLLAVAWKEMLDTCVTLAPDDESALVIAGYCVFEDRPKASASAAIKRLKSSGVRTKVLSGDNEIVVQHVADTLKISSRGILTGAKISELSDSALAGLVRTTDLFARVSPDQKSRIIRALQSNGFTVGFIGDGVNDAPAIRAAEVGISVEGATDIARSAADLIMLDRDLAVLADGVDEGRTTFANILKYIRMGTSSNFGNMLSMATASLFIPFLPLLPVQILLNNLLYDLSEVGIPFDRVDREELKRPRAWDFPNIFRFTLAMGALSSCFDFLTFGVLLRFFEATPDVFRTAWFVESIATQLLVIFIIRTSGRTLKSRPARILLITSIGALSISLFIALSPIGATFGFVPIPMTLLFCISGIVVAYLLAAETIKALAKDFLFRSSHVT
jgi:Mg2+-importing ATPase